MTQPEDFDKDIELAKLQVDATMWAAWFSMLFSAGSAMIVGAFVAGLAYALTYPNAPVSLGEVFLVGTTLVCGSMLLWKARRDDGDRREEWENRFKEISKRVKAGKEPKP